MLKQKDIEAAVAAGIISQDQADSLNDFAATQRQSRSFGGGRDERFRLLGGFNDFFVAIGVILLASGLMFGLGPTTSLSVALTGIVVLWGLAELLTGRLRLTAPSIVISVFLAVFAFLAATAFLGTASIEKIVTNKTGQISWLVLVTTGFTFFVTLVHYLRFRFPFTLWVCALALLLNIIALNAVTVKLDTNLVVFLFGCLVFAGAMRFDLTDLDRLTRRADKGFWLHLAAAPLIVHPLVTSISTVENYDNLSVLLIIAVISVLTLIALLIDRRALIVTALGYLGSAIAFGVSRIVSGDQASGAVSSESSVFVAFVTLVFLGAIIILLGVGWHSIRRTVLRNLPDFGYKAHLPSYEKP